MSQTSYSINMTKGLAGQLADNGNAEILSYTCQGDVPFGRVVVASLQGKNAFLPAVTNGDLEFDANLVTNNSIEVNFNGNTVNVDFDSDNNTTLEAIATAISAFDGFVAVRDGTDSVDITSQYEPLTGVSATVTGGASQAGATFTDTTTGSNVAGVALSSQREQDLAGNAKYTDTDTVSVLSRGRVYIEGETDLTTGDSLFYRTANGDLGAIRNDNAGGDATALNNARVVESATSGNLAVVEINLP